MSIKLQQDQKTAAFASPGRKFRDLVAAASTDGPVQVMGTINAYCALMAEKAGAKAIYLSGSGVATASCGLPDLGITNLNDVVTDISRITDASSLPLLVDIDTGFGSCFGIARCIRLIEKAGAAAVHIEDQKANKRCGHRPGKAIVSEQEMVDRISSAVAARKNPDFVIMARTDGLANYGMKGLVSRCKLYVDAGADMLFPEAMTTLAQYQELTTALQQAYPDRQIPILANITEFGKTPLFSTTELKEVGVGMVLYPLTAHRAMAKAAWDVYSSVLTQGHQKDVIPLMQTRAELYDMLNYHAFEDTLDALEARATTTAAVPKSTEE